MRRFNYEPSLAQTMGAGKNYLIYSVTLFLGEMIWRRNYDKRNS